MNRRIAIERLANLRIDPATSGTPAAVVAWCGAIQAQDYTAAMWAVALRSEPATASDLDRALDSGAILRTHVLRPTWHLVTRDDIRWMLSLTAERVQRALGHAYRARELDAALRTRAARAFERALSSQGCLTRAELGAALARTGLAVTGIRLALLTLHAELEGVLCSGPRRGTQSTYALLDARTKQTSPLSRDEALERLTAIYFRSHGPATARDFAWWSGLTMSDVRRGIDLSQLSSFTDGDLVYWTTGDDRPAPARRRAPRVHLLPVYDEYLVAYRDLEAVPRGPTVSGVLPQAVVIDGQVAGTWKAGRRTPPQVDVRVDRELTTAERRGLATALERYRRFRGAS